MRVLCQTALDRGCEKCRSASTIKPRRVPATRYFGLYYHDPAGTSAADLRSDACLTAPPGFAGEGDLRPVVLGGGRHAVLLHVGPYAELHRAYTWLYREWLPTSGYLPANRPCVEEYLNNPRQVPPSELRTEIWLPLEDVGDAPAGVLTA